MSRAWLAPASPLYRAALAIKNTAYDRHWISSRLLADPVVSVGNISTGGAGKTPFVIYLAQQLQAHGLHPDVLSRGYGRASSASAQRIDPDGSASRFGDEPVLIARTTGVPVYVAANRLDAGLLAEAATNDEDRIHLLDDGFQHRQLARTVDIVLVHANDFADRLLPAGNLREPLSALKRAHITVLREEHRDYASKVMSINGRAPWIVRRMLQVHLNGKQPLAFCGVAHPEEFFRDLRAHGITLAAEISFADHHRYTASDMRRLLDTAQRSGADSLITTEKDAVKLPPPMIATLEQSGKLAIARLVLSLENEEQCIAELTALLA